MLAIRQGEQVFNVSVFDKKTKTLTLNLNKPLESIKDNYPKYVATMDSLLQKRGGIEHINLVDFMKNGKEF